MLKTGTWDKFQADGLTFEKGNDAGILFQHWSRADGGGLQSPSDGIPAIIEITTRKGTTHWTVLEQHCNDACGHRIKGPAEIFQDENGKIEEVWYRNKSQPYHPTAHERMEWEATKAAQGGTPFHPQTQAFIQECRDREAGREPNTSGVKAAAAAAKAAEPKVAKTKTADRGDAR